MRERVGSEKHLRHRGRRRVLTIGATRANIHSASGSGPTAYPPGQPSNRRRTDKAKSRPVGVYTGTVAKMSRQRQKHPYEEKLREDATGNRAEGKHAEEGEGGEHSERGESGDKGRRRGGGKSGQSGELGTKRESKR